ncbi:hypothetical protein MTR67_020544 [Solanum verrucosum]|uniref:Transmembrane protein n=1 Tax=Solanum verrucosum TaxID=315347 RepID=A0AAF0TPJ1_SOLVR|nr:hypothetical protein MTR67_020544 [Solanum verrucosum]
MGASLAIALKCLFAILGCLVTGFSWVVYKEANWITAIPWAVLLVCFRSITICGYILLQFLKLSTQESLQDPVYFVLLQCQKKTETEQWRKYSLLTARILSLALGSLMLGTLIYILVTYGSPFHRDTFTPWMTTTLIDHFVFAVPLSVWVAYKESSWLSAAFWIIPIILFGSTITCAYIALQLFSLSSQDPAYLVLFSSSSSNRQSWVVYKESNWITAILWVVLLVCLGSIATCGYIVLQFLKLSTQESLQDPIYFVLLRRQEKTETEQQRKCSLLTARILFPALGCLMLGTLIYTIVTDGSPFRRDVFTPWLTATVIDFYVGVVALSVWVAYKESSWLSAAFWIILIICSGSISTCAYIALQLFNLSSQDPVYLVLFSSSSNSNRQVCAPSV